MAEYEEFKQDSPLLFYSLLSTRKIPFSALKNEIKKYLLVYILTNPADISFILFFEAEKGIILVLFRGLKPLP